MILSRSTRISHTPWRTLAISTARAAAVTSVPYTPVARRAPSRLSSHRPSGRLVMRYVTQTASLADAASSSRGARDAIAPVSCLSMRLPQPSTLSSLGDTCPASTISCHRPFMPSSSTISRRNTRLHTGNPLSCANGVRGTLRSADTEIPPRGFCDCPRGFWDYRHPGLRGRKPVRSRLHDDDLCLRFAVSEFHPCDGTGSPKPPRSRGPGI